MANCQALLDAALAAAGGVGRSLPVWCFLLRRIEREGGLIPALGFLGAIQVLLLFCLAVPRALALSLGALLVRLAGALCP